ncbi:hypothetical protein DVH05_016931 [Phytophthora capsici]|nr:hypothetical protein DVH05_016931 [Phytophthora capsici]
MAKRSIGLEVGGRKKDEGQQQRQKRQRLATNTSDSDDEAKATTKYDILVTLRPVFYLKVEALLVEEKKQCVTVTGTSGTYMSE